MAQDTGVAAGFAEGDRHGGVHSQDLIADGVEVVAIF